MIPNKNGLPLYEPKYVPIVSNIIYRSVLLKTYVTFRKVLLRRFVTHLRLEELFITRKQKRKEAERVKLRRNIYGKWKRYWKRVLIQKR